MARVCRERKVPCLLIAGAIEDYRGRPVAAQHELEFSSDAALPELLIDPLKISQVLGNLLDNALKYTPKGTHIVVTAKRQESEQNRVERVAIQNGEGGDGEHDECRRTIHALDRTNPATVSAT